MVFQKSSDPDGRQADTRQTDRDAAAEARANALLAQLAARKSSLPQAWNEIFKAKPRGNDTLAAAFLILHNRGEYDVCVEGLLAAIRNDHVQPWMYEVLEVEMVLAERPQKEIDRVLLSRIDFADGSDAQMLVTVALMSRLGAYKQALKICRELAKRNPWQTAMWAMARRVADRSRDSDAIVWSRAGTLRYVWDAEYEISHAEARATLEDLAQDLRLSGNVAAADAVTRELRKAAARDLEIEIAWAGNADLDLIVHEPGGQICSYKSRLTANGGVLAAQSDGGVAAGSGRSRRTEKYVCVQAPSGDYVVQVRNIVGRLITGKVQVRVTRHRGTPQERTESRLYTLGDRKLEIRVPLKAGRGVLIEPEK